jgi:hypothetical protein
MSQKSEEIIEIINLTEKTSTEINNLKSLLKEKEELLKAMSRQQISLIGFETTGRIYSINKKFYQWGWVTIACAEYRALKEIETQEI